MKKATPISVSECIEVYDAQGHYIGESQVIVEFRGRCIPRMIFGDTYISLPRVRGGNIYHINYMHDSDISVIDYRFSNTPFRNRLKASERFRNKILKQIMKQEIKEAVSKIKDKYHEKQK